MSLRKASLRVDTSQDGSFTDYGGNQFTPYAHVDETVLLNFAFLETLAEGSKTALDLAGNTAYRVIVRETRLQSSNQLAYQNVWNNGDNPSNESWAGGLGTALLGFGDAAVATHLGSNTSVTAWLEVSTLSAGGYEQVLFQTEITIYPKLYGAGATVPSPAVNYYTQTESLDLFMIKRTSDAIDATAIAQTAIYTVPSGFIFVAEHGDEMCTEITGASAAHESQWGISTDTDSMWAPHASKANALRKRNPIQFSSDLDGFAAGDIIQFGVTQASTASTSHSIKATLKGYLINA